MFASIVRFRDGKPRGAPIRIAPIVKDGVDLYHAGGKLIVDSKRKSSRESLVIPPVLPMNAAIISKGVDVGHEAVVEIASEPALLRFIKCEALAQVLLGATKNLNAPRCHSEAPA